MSSTTTSSPTGSGARHGRTWGARARDWALNEEQQVPTYEAVADRIGVSAGRRVLEVGCGTGVFLRTVVDRGAEAVGLDASARLLELARARVPEAELHEGDMQFLPFADDSFDAVAGFNSFFFAADMVEALREAGRVAKPGAPVAIQVWGRPERCDLTAMKVAAQSLLPEPPPAQPSLAEPGLLEGLAAAAGLQADEAFDVTWAFEFPDEEILARAMLSPGLMVELMEVVGEESLREAIVAGLEPYRTADGGYRLENEWHVLVARA